MANVGDCALLIIRDNEVVFRSTEGTHGFNHPMQLGPHSKDEPMKDANQWKFEVRKEDVVVMASDGLVDNMVSPSGSESVVVPAIFWKS
jgi:protein phosphatase PTC7